MQHHAIGRSNHNWIISPNRWALVQRSYLVHGAEDMGVVLLEAAHAGQTGQRSRQLVPVQHPEVG